MKYWQIFGVVFSLFLHSNAQKISAFVDSKNIEVGDILRYTVKISGTNQAPSPKFPQFKHFQQLAGIEISKESGNMGESSISYTKFYTPNKTGKFRTASFKYSYAGQTFLTPIFKITVSEISGNTPKKKNDTDIFGQFEDMFNDIFDDFRPKRNKKIFEDFDVNVQMVNKLSKEEVYVGEQVLQEAVLLIERKDQRNIELSSEEIIKLQQKLKENGFWQEVLQFSVLPSENITLGGKNYVAIVLFKAYLFPLSPQNYVYKDISMKVDKVIRAKGANIFDNLLSSNKKYKAITITANDTKLKIKALPKTNLQNATAVGQFKIDASFKKNQLKAGEILDLLVSIEGNATPALIPQPNVDFPESFQVYEPTSDYTVSYSDYGFNVKKQFQFAAVPMETGKFRIPPIKFNFFDPKAKKYRTIKTKSLEISVKGTNVEMLKLQDAGIQNYYKDNLEHADDELRMTSNQRNHWAILFVLLPFLIAGGIWVYRTGKSI